MKTLNSDYDYMGDYDLYGPRFKDDENISGAELELDRDDIKESVVQYVSDVIDELLHIAESKELSPTAIEENIEGYNSDESTMGSPETAEQRKLWDEALDALTRYYQSKLFDDDYASYYYN